MENVTLNFLGNCERKKAKKRATILYKKLSLSIENGWNHVTFLSVGGGIECEVYVLISKTQIFVWVLCGCV
jgi:hypothetical protein